MDILDIDIETYSSVDLKKANVYAYTESPDFEIIMCSYGLNDEPVQVIESHEEFQDRLRDIPGLWDPDVKKAAHNAPFERICFSRYDGKPVGEYLPPEEWFDTAAVAAQYGLPRSLAALARALKVDAKDSAGTRLINLFCMPHKGRRVMPEERPEEWLQFLTYGLQDTVVLRQVRHRLKRWPSAFERDLWYADQRINDRGMRVDVELAAAGVEAAKRNTARDEERVIEITSAATDLIPDEDGDVPTVTNPGSTQQLGRWTAARGFPMPNWRKETVKDALQRSDLPEDVREVLALRQELALVAHRKFEAALRGVSIDGRLRGQFVFNAAHTGRWSSRGVQVHNLAKKGFVVPGTDDYDELMEDIAITRLLKGGVADADTLKMLVRPMFLGPLGVSDLSAIEARVLAWIAGEEPVLQAFREGKDLYVDTAERMGGGMRRPEGKIAVLAGGYQGSVGSLRAMGYGGRLCPLDTVRPTKRRNTKTGEFTEEYDHGGVAQAREALSADEQRARTSEAVTSHLGPGVMESEAVRRFLASEEAGYMGLEEALRRVLGHVAERERDPGHKCDFEVRRVVEAYRAANPRIVEFWYDMQKKFWTGGVVGAGKIRVERDGSRRKIHLPSGRFLLYHEVTRRQEKVEDPETGETRLSERPVLRYRHVQGYRESTYGGRLTENVTQAVARDFLAEALVKFDKAGLPVVGHVHDEALNDFEGWDEARVAEAVEFIHHTMRTPPDWASDMPLDASIGVLERYRKD